jgi:hypothetical protein
MEKHVKALADFPPPADLKDLQRFLGLINFYRRFLPGIAGTLQPLTDLLRGNPKTLDWSDSAAATFRAAKEALISATALAHPLPGAVISLAADASDTHIGGVLQQLSSGSWQPLAFFSRKFQVPNRNILLSTESCWPFSLLSAISGSCWKDVSFGSSQTIYPSHSPCDGYPPSGQQGKCAS